MAYAKYMHIDDKIGRLIAGMPVVTQSNQWLILLS